MEHNKVIVEKLILYKRSLLNDFSGTNRIGTKHIGKTGKRTNSTTPAILYQEIEMKVFFFFFFNKFLYFSYR